MPIVSAFFGLIVRVFHDDHNPPHFHVEYAEFKVVVEISTGKVLQGKLPKRALQILEEWRKQHIGELMSAWNEAQSGKPPKRIAPLQ